MIKLFLFDAQDVVDGEAEIVICQIVYRGELDGQLISWRVLLRLPDISVAREVVWRRARSADREGEYHHQQFLRQIVKEAGVVLKYEKKENRWTRAICISVYAGEFVENEKFLPLKVARMS